MVTRSKAFTHERIWYRLGSTPNAEFSFGRIRSAGKAVSDTVALLGQHHEVTPEVLELFKEIKRQRALCRDAEEKFERYVQQESDNAKAAGAA